MEYHHYAYEHARERKSVRSKSKKKNFLITFKAN